MKKVIIIIGSVCSIAVLLGTWAPWRSGEASGAEQTRKEDVAEARPARGGRSEHSASIDALARSVGALVERMEQLEAKLEERGPEREPELKQAPKSPEEQLAADKVETLQRLATINESFQSEQRDRSWAPERERELTQAFSEGAFAGTRLVRTDCKATFCKMEVQHESVDNQRPFELIRRRLEGSYYIQHLEPDQNGKVGSVAFFLRKGHEKENIIAQLMTAPSDGTE